MSGLQWSDAKRYLQDLEAVLAGSGGSDVSEALSALRSARVELQSIFTASQLNGKTILSGASDCARALAQRGTDAQPLPQTCSTACRTSRPLAPTP